jgi:hypothetical protein
MPEHSLTATRYEVRTCWHNGEKRFVIHDLQRDREVLGVFHSAHDASVRCTLLWLEHLKTTRRTRRRVPLTSVGS